MTSYFFRQISRTLLECQHSHGSNYGVNFFGFIALIVLKCLIVMCKAILRPKLPLGSFSHSASLRRLPCTALTITSNYWWMHTGEGSISTPLLVTEECEIPSAIIFIYCPLVFSGWLISMFDVLDNISPCLSHYQWRRFLSQSLHSFLWHTLELVII